jgi:hypothetical protein
VIAPQAANPKRLGQALRCVVLGNKVHVAERQAREFGKSRRRDPDANGHVPAERGTEFLLCKYASFAGAFDRGGRI